MTAGSARGRGHDAPCHASGHDVGLVTPIRRCLVPRSSRRTTTDCSQMISARGLLIKRRCIPQRSFSTSLTKWKQPRKTSVKTNYNNLSFSDSPDLNHVNYRRVTANELENLKEPPTEVKMLVRDFIEDSLYNPHYGYFPKQATIFTYTDPIDFKKMRNAVEFQDEVARRYESFETTDEGPGRQIWHTPTELFKVCSFCLCIV